MGVELKEITERWECEQEQCCSIKHKHKPQHTSAHVLLTPFEIHTQKQPPHCKETSTFQSSSSGSVLCIIKKFLLFFAAESKKTKTGNFSSAISQSHNQHDMHGEQQSTCVSKWAKGRSGTVTEPAQIEHCNSYKQSVEDDMSPPKPHMTSFTSPDLTFKRNTNNLF